ncbi:hotdog fold thioesterase [Zobellella sp. DQSA1]|uniref:hotdog fold thioesterase n=1 Tax=Zobellella sp. DQSA1 TaxID=3342386 RepID=UPI0035C0BA8D
MWKREFTLDSLNQLSENTLAAQLGMTFCEVGHGFLSGTMPVDHRTHQPLGMLHGGASVALAETLGSVAANMCVEAGYYCVGLEVNANHVRAKRSGLVTGTARPLHLGATTQVWQIDIHDEKDRLVCTSRLTMAVLRQKRPD